ncbi:MAG: penicillin-binding protein 2 [Mariprofundus sp.]|nr:penicillin-binding protein 2 [Mariprofundus sp.]
MNDKEQLFVRRRIEFIAGLLALAILLLVVRVVDLQWLQGDKLSNMAEKQRYREFTTQAMRGPILDHKGRVLAESVEVPSIAAVADEVPASSIALLAEKLGISVKRLHKKLYHRTGFVWLARQISPARAARVMALDIAGVRMETEWRRYQPLGPVTGHLLGFVGIDGNGLEGMERRWNSALKGEAGIRQVRRDARGHSLPDGVWLRDAVAGKALTLTLDATIQSVAYAALADAVHEQHAKGGSVVVLRPADGAVLAMANWPGYNPNNFGKYHPGEWRNRAITDVFEPGSTMKPFTIAAALQSGRWQPDSLIFCENGSMKIADYTIHDDHKEGWLDVTGILMRSSNIGAAKLALDVGSNKLYSMLEGVGFGRRSGAGLSGESRGIVLAPERWGPVETANIAFGQGIAVTPLQLAAAFSVLANKGVYTVPRLFVDQEKKQKRVLTPTIAAQILTMLEFATSANGTGNGAVPAGYRIGGKTGTAQKPGPHGSYSKEKYMAVFAGIAPIDDPQLVIVVVVDEPQNSIYGGTVAAPVFRHIAESVLPYLGVPVRIEDPTAWRKMAIAAEAPARDESAIYGMSMREIRRYAGKHGIRLHVHGSGWVERYKPRALLTLEQGDALEVWLHD